MITDELRHRILILDGATGTVLQQYGLTEADFRGERFANHPVPLKGDHDLLNLTRPDIVRQTHQDYIRAGADIIKTNTFNANAVSQAKYDCAGLAAELNRTGAQIARQAADECSDRRIFVAGSIGPTDKSLTLATDPDNPTRRAADFDTLAQAYSEQTKALIEGGVDLLLVAVGKETLVVDGRALGGEMAQNGGEARHVMDAAEGFFQRVAGGFVEGEEQHDVGRGQHVVEHAALPFVREAEVVERIAKLLLKVGQGHGRHGPRGEHLHGAGGALQDGLGVDGLAQVDRERGVGAHFIGRKVETGLAPAFVAGDAETGVGKA